MTHINIYKSHISDKVDAELISIFIIVIIKDTIIYLFFKQYGVHNFLNPRLLSIYITRINSLRMISKYWQKISNLKSHKFHETSKTNNPNPLSFNNTIFNSKNLIPKLFTSSKFSYADLWKVDTFLCSFHKTESLSHPICISTFDVSVVTVLCYSKDFTSREKYVFFFFLVLFASLLFLTINWFDVLSKEEEEDILIFLIICLGWN